MTSFGCEATLKATLVCQLYNFFYQTALDTPLILLFGILILLNEKVVG